MCRQHNLLRLSQGMLLIAMLAIAVGCSGGDNNSTSDDMGSEQKDDMSMSMTDDMGGDASADTDASEDTVIPNMYEARYEMRFDSLAFTAETLPDKSSLVSVLNGLLKQNFDQSLENPIVILLDIKSIDADAGTMQLRSGAGLKTVNEGEYEWHSMTPAGYVDGGLEATSGEVSGSIPEFIFIATIGTGEDANSVPLVINDLQFKATLEDADEAGLAQIQTGTLEGYMTKANGDTAMIETSPGNVTTITAFFGEEAMDYDSDNDGENDSWYLYATFTAIPAEID